ncbi:40S ribosomal S10-like protein [Medicago truncatula]|uniref:40S ribosomal S10-like protein n=1 Tax=Medicago truncatula TaxID=3880 RepID=A0A072UCU4_MEDTR|nr:40S ribosomal S10-like protein [Medicago truncatula]
MADMFDVQAQFNGGEPQRLKVWYLGVTLRDLKDQLNEFNQGVNPGDTRRVEYVRYKRPTFDDERISFSWVELANNGDMKSMFWEHNMLPWIDMCVTLLRLTDDILNSSEIKFYCQQLNSLIPSEDRD